MNAVLIAAAALFLGVAILLASRTVQSHRSAVAAASGADLVVAEGTFADGRARFYSYTTSAGQGIRFFVMKSADGVVRAAMDACTVCYRHRGIIDLFIGLKRSGLTVFMVTHDPVSAERADRLLHIEDGVLQ